MHGPLKRSRIARIVACAGLIIALARTTAIAADEPARPNIIILLADDLGYGDLACYGHRHVQSPHLDRLAQDGMRFTDFYAAAPVCSPSRAGLLTGRTPSRLGIHDWIPAKSAVHLPLDEVTIPALLKGIGYQTCHVGKWHLNGLFNNNKQPQPTDHGFDHWMATQNNAGFSHENPANFVRNGDRVGETQGFSSDLIVDEAVRWLQHRETDKPFFLNLWFHSTHEPVATAKQYADLYADVMHPDKAQYFGNVTQMDAAIGRLLKYLDDQRLAANTLIVFTSDNGPETLNRYKGGNRSHGSPGNLRGMKLWLYEGGIRVPGMLRWPAQVKAGQVIATPIHFCDLLPTLCELAGAELPHQRALDGVSLVPLLRGENLSRSRPLYWQYNRALGAPKLAIRDGDWKLLADAETSAPELYNIVEDPKETRLLNSDEPQRLQELTAKLQKMRDEVAADTADSGNPAE